MSDFKSFCDMLELRIQESYEEGVTAADAEALAGQFLHGQLQVSKELHKLDLDARMRKTGVKAVKAAVYLAEIQKVDKKPSDVLLSALVDSSDLVTGEQNRLDTAEADRDELERLYNVFIQAHVHFRQMSKGNFG